MQKFSFVIFFVLLVIGANISAISYSQSKPFTKTNLIAFSSDATNNDKQQIFIMDSQGNGVKQVCQEPLDCFSPRFSPDGKKIVFTATNVVSDFIYMIDLEDTSTWSFPKFIDGGADPQFSPDGQYLLYHSEKNDDNAIYILDLQSDSSFSINDGSMSTHAKFSPDGRKVVYSSSASGNFDLVVLDLDDTSDNAQRTIAATPDAEIYGTFSPDSKLIAYASFDVNYKGTVHVCKADGKNNITITKGMGSSYNPKFSPDGSKLAFVSDKSGNYEVYICNPDGSDIRQLTSKKGNTIEFDWSSDSKKISYENIKESISSINVIDLATGESENLTGEKANNVNPCFQK